MASISQRFLLLLLISAVYAVQPPSTSTAPAPAPHGRGHHHHQHHHSYPPTPPPAHPPVYSPPLTPSAHPPSSSPSPRKYVAVQGVVYCKSCKYTGVDTLTGASPLPGAVVKLQCNNTKVGLKEQTKTDKNGYFFFMPMKLTTSGSHKCKVYIVSSSLPACNVTTDFYGGASGAILMPSKKPPSDQLKPLPFVLFTVGPFAFEADKKLPCHY